MSSALAAHGDFGQVLSWHAEPEERLRFDTFRGEPRNSDLAVPARGDPPIEGLRYQLLTACAGALCEAERLGSPRTLMLVHEFVTDKTPDEKHARNAGDLDAFLKRLSRGADRAPRSGEIRGPFNVPGAPLLTTDVALFLG